MDHRNNPKDSLSYSNLFNLEPLMNFQLPQRDDDFGYYGNSSQDDESRDSRGGGAMASHSNGNVNANGREVNLLKRAWSQNSDEEERSRFYGTCITEERYRSMLGEHVQKYKRRFKDTSSTHAQNQVAVPPVQSSSGSKARKSGNDHYGGLHAAEIASEWLYDSNSQKPGNYHDANFLQRYASDRTMYEPASLDITDGISYKIPPKYDKLASMLNLPNFSDIHVDEFYLKGTLDLGSLAAMVATDKRFMTTNRGGMGEPMSQYDSLQARLKAMSASNSPHKFSLKVSNVGLNSFIPEGAAGNIKRSILSEGGVLQVYYVKVLEKGDTYEIIERSLPKKQKVKKDPALIEKEERDRIGKIWVNIVRRDVPKHHRNFTIFHRKQLMDAKRFSENCQREVRMKVSRSLRWTRGASIRTRKLARDMLFFWKRADKEMIELRKREEKEAAEALRREQELREAKRQQQRLNFLIQQTELYSHFMQNKSSLLSSEALPMEDEKADDQDALFDSSDAGPIEDDPEEAELKKEALKAAQEAVSKQRKLTSAFDSECLRLRQAGEADPLSQEVAGASDIDLQTPSTMPVASTVQTPELFKGCLKEYQLKGLQWLVNCYEQGLNGILADEMGLGKTIQAMVFLAHLAEEKNIWGPFLVVAPASVLNNWNEELERFCPELKRLPYWGGVAERSVLRKSINPKDLYRRDAKFHIVITSYQLLVQDEKFFRRVKWQYMVLDEAQAIKNSTSIRWKTLLSFNCRNRLLLTGTPIQNNMAELWALLHFIMPTLFDSHEQFNEWFSKGIENHAEHGGTLNEHQLNRLHSILKPFMLRRVKKDVVSELTKKTEVMVHCKLSSRQQAFYQAIKNKISLAELFDSNRGQLNEKKILNLMNIVIQLRKVCNHPELFERSEGSTYFYFAEIPNSLPPPPFGELEDIYYPGGHNPISYEMPKLVYQEIMQRSETFCSTVGHGVCRESFQKHFNIFTPENIYRSMISEGVVVNSGNFGFTRLVDLSPQEVTFLASSSFLERLLFSMMRWERKFLDEFIDFLMETTVSDPECSYLEKGTVRAVTRMLLLPSRSEAQFLERRFATGPTCDPFEALVISHQHRLLSNARLLHAAYTYIPPTRAPPIAAHCPDRNFSYKMIEELHDPWVKRLFVGFARTSESTGPRKPVRSPHHLIEEIDSELPISHPALKFTHEVFGCSPPMHNFDPAKLLTDSGKLQTLDILLKRLRAGNHRVLLFAQMTKMLNILEDYMNYRKYKYFRLDGSSTIQDRRDMVKDFQDRSDVFVFLLSTRAGGLGINLTAADTVIFYESDWNPTLDLQAMDRAHRLGQTKDVTVYRLICKETVEEKILLRASQKSTVQNLVMTGGSVGGDLLAPEDVVSLLLDDVQLEQKLKEIPIQVKDKEKKKKPTKGIRVNEDGDASLEDLTNSTAQGTTDFDLPMDPEGSNASNKKRKAASRPRNSQKPSESGIMAIDYELDDNHLTTEPVSHKPKRPKRMKNVNEKFEESFTASATIFPEKT
ncbi:chromatin-remodeling ATPase INO80 isoform X1 [Arachis duranensis]|uniref:Chromatin-remodeling ATPase INO80 n=2 Tax=Arachis duranensis TaxID=130453 RepID=A0A9C6WTY3_ARADU|nr:chromatin-remodeling ATPase INO80 isoform X1 [Arachis duranensis]XP_052114814.1 chromatin-remodeling ATPase INO80 isoform X1 [Arachis duranensis]XP_052114815.1 chromatin-remodeling ATPase INO80 isoform X1 [Arachis duranensis]XP_052114816.1 chromatin-remodeling ATPase INO80 isoform X1 [Arachis duranensis]